MYQVQRTQYPFDLSGVRCKSRGDVMIMQRQWNTFERVENYNDIIFQRISDGLRNMTYYQFVDRGELSDYNNGQQLHILRYPNLPPSTFCSISLKPFPNVPIISPAPVYAQDPKCGQFSTSITESEKIGNNADMAVYVHVSSYNSSHVYKYIFTSNEERLAYHRAERQVLNPSS